MALRNYCKRGTTSSHKHYRPTLHVDLGADIIDDEMLIESAYARHAVLLPNPGPLDSWS